MKSITTFSATLKRGSLKNIKGGGSSWAIPYCGGGCTAAEEGGRPCPNVPRCICDAEITSPFPHVGNCRLLR